LPHDNWLKEYRRDWLRPDVIAGLTTAAVVIPKAMAYATIAGLPVQVGLYTAFVPMLIYALTGSSRPLSVSTSTTLAILMGAQLSLLVPDGDAGALQRASATLVLMVGAILLLASVLRLGFVANFISEPVLTGFKAGIGVVIVVDQIPKLLGIHFPKGPFFGNLLSIVKGIPETSVPTLCVALAMIALLFALEHWTPRAPAPLIAVAVGERTVHFKCEHLNPTGSFKDRGAAVLVSALVAGGVVEAMEDSSGNAGAAFAAFNLGLTLVWTLILTRLAPEHRRRLVGAPRPA